MSDENSKDRHPQREQRGQRGPGRAASAPGGAKRTMIGLPVSDPRNHGQSASDAEPARPGLAGHGHRPATSDTIPQNPPRTAHSPAPAKDDGYIADKLYMDPPSETFGRAPTHAAIPAPVAHAAPPQAEPERGPNFAATALRAAQVERVERGSGHNPAGAALNAAAQQTMQERMPAPRTSFANPSAPEAWRNDVRRMADRGTGQASQAPRPAAAGNASLRLKLDAADPDDHYRGVPKSSLPNVLLWLFVLVGLGGAAAYWVDEQGGLVAARTRLEGLVSGHSVPATPAVTSAPPAAAPAQPATPPPTAAEPATPAQAAPPSAAGAQTQGESAAQALADPEPPTAAPSKPEPAKPEAKAKPAEEKPKPAPKPAAPPRRVVRHDPVITVKPIGSSAAPSNDVPPAPEGATYVPNIPDPPAPDGSR